MFTYLLEYNRYLNFIGIGFIVFIAWLLSSHKKFINWKQIRNALFLQITIAVFVLKTYFGIYFIEKCSEAVSYLYQFASEGVAFLFGNLALSQNTPWGAVFAIQILPMIVFFGAFMSLLFHLGIVQKVVGFLGFFMRPLLGTTGPETLCAVANCFLGQTESPLLIKSYLSKMTRSEIFVVMVSGMSTISGALLAVYASMGAPLQHLLASSIMAIPGSIMLAKIMVPETETVNYDNDDMVILSDKSSSNIFDSISKGTTDGLFLALNVAAMLLSFTALLSMVNYLLYGISSVIHLWIVSFPIVSLNVLLAFIFKPFAYILGMSGVELQSVSELLGTKVAVNEFLAYCKLSSFDFSPRTLSIVTYALCGFSNFSCIGIQVGGIGALAPEKRSVLAEFGMRAVLCGALTNILTACIASILL